MRIKFYVRLSNENDVPEADLSLLINVGAAFSSLLESVAKMLVSENQAIVDGEAEGATCSRLVKISMLPTEKGSYLIPFVVDLLANIDPAIFQNAVEQVLKIAEQLSNNSLVAAAVGSYIGTKASQQKGNSRNTSLAPADETEQNILSNVSVRQSMIDLSSVYQYSESVNPCFTVETDAREPVFSHDIDSPKPENTELAGTLHFVDKELAIKPMSNPERGKSKTIKFTGLVDGDKRQITVNEAQALAIKRAGYQNIKTMVVTADGDLIVEKKTGKPYYKNIVVKELLNIL